MTQDDIRNYLGKHPTVATQIAAEGDGSPPIAWGDTFFYMRGADGVPKKMPFVTIVTKDYPGFDTESRLDRGGLYRLNIDVGRARLEQLFGVPIDELTQQRGRFAFDASDCLFPHPTYGAHGWVSVINPRSTSAQVFELLDAALARATPPR